MKKIIATIIIVLAAEALGWVVCLYWGIYNIGTRNHDNAVVNWALDTGMTRSVALHARGIHVPKLTDPALIQKGFQHYDEMCVGCHGAPGVAPGEIAQGLWPKAPDLGRSVPTWTPAQLFWITKNGIKFTAMPAWGPSHDDGELWALVAFLERLPQLSPADYQQEKQSLTSGPEPHGQGSERNNKAEKAP